MIRLNIGCGPKAVRELRRPGYIHVDKENYGQDIIADALDIDLHYKGGTVDEIVCDMFLEHLRNEKVVEFLNVCWHVLKDSGRIEIEVPVFDRGGAYEITHKSYYSKHTFESFEREEVCKECGLKPFKVTDVRQNQKGNIYCTLTKVKDYIIPMRT